MGIPKILQKGAQDPGSHRNTGMDMVQSATEGFVLGFGGIKIAKAAFSAHKEKQKTQQEINASKARMEFMEKVTKEKAREEAAKHPFPDKSFETNARATMERMRAQGYDVSEIQKFFDNDSSQQGIGTKDNVTMDDLFGH